MSTTASSRSSSRRPRDLQTNTMLQDQKRSGPSTLSSPLRPLLRIMITNRWSAARQTPRLQLGLVDAGAPGASGETRLLTKMRWMRRALSLGVLAYTWTMPACRKDPNRQSLARAAIGAPSLGCSRGHPAEAMWAQQATPQRSADGNPADLVA